MSLSEMRAKIKANIWQTIAQSEVNVSTVPQEEMDKLVGAIAEGVLRNVDDILSQATGKLSATSVIRTDDEEDEVEKVLWEGRPFLSIRVYYQITNERVRITEGLLAKERHDIELVRIQDIDHKQNLAERTFNLGDVFIRSHDVSNPELVLNNVIDPVEVHEVLRRAVLKARQKYNMSYREEM